MKVSDLIYTLGRSCEEILKKFVRVALETYNSGRSRPSDKGGGGGGHPDPEIRVRGPVSKKRSAPVQENAKIANLK